MWSATIYENGEILDTVNVCKTESDSILQLKDFLRWKKESNPETKYSYEVFENKWNVKLPSIIRLY